MAWGTCCPTWTTSSGPGHERTGKATWANPEATLRLGGESYRIKVGDYVGFPAGRRAGHCLVNETDKPFRFIMIGDHDPNEVCVYPDSNNILMRGLDRAILRDGERLDYFDGEKAGEPVK